MSKRNVMPQAGEARQEHPLIYCGPSIPGIAPHGMLFTEMPPQLSACAEECPAIRRFLAEPADYVKVKQQAEHKGSLLHTLRLAVLEYIQRR